MTGGTFWRIRTKDNADHLHEFLLRSLSEGRDMILREEETTRTSKQNNAMWGCMRRLAESLNSAGQEMAHPFNASLLVPWTAISAKELLLKPIIEARYGKTSTTKLSRAEISEAVDILLGRITELTGLYIAGMEGEE